MKERLREREGGKEGLITDEGDPTTFKAPPSLPPPLARPTGRHGRSGRPSEKEDGGKDKIEGLD